MKKRYLLITLAILAILAISSLLFKSTYIQSIVVNHELRNTNNIYKPLTLKMAQRFGFNTDLIHQSPATFKDIKKPVLEGYVKATDYLSEEQVVETSDAHNPKAIVYILKSEAPKIKERGYLWCTKQITLQSDNSVGYISQLIPENEAESKQGYIARVATELESVYASAFVEQLNMLGFTVVQNGFHSGAMMIAIKGRVIDLDTFSCNKESQEQIIQDLKGWADLLIKANQTPIN